MKRLLLRLVVVIQCDDLVTGGQNIVGECHSSDC